MKIYVYAEAYTPTEEYAEIKATKVFLKKEDAVNYLKAARNMYLNYPDDEGRWKITYDTDTYLHMIYDGEADECVLCVDEHEI